ncbi:hypothetical protein SVI_1822 [Shewanella violacea DSS12]|uniref:Uncharacterized protein n=1 Tax=Shewanella violacea (strain JCM 10179 / CIP 106290 / LMG 19151 / DSS12) TaxID=637905 RepID=D4ZJE4_SHEVD|nr:hypothetical protein SVI_1822 [Shewanella violacea DSS12]
MSALISHFISKLVLSCIDDFQNKTHYPLDMLNDSYLKLAQNNNA